MGNMSDRIDIIDDDDDEPQGRDVGRFNWNFRVMAARHLENRGHAGFENGGRVILPPRALEELSRALQQQPRGRSDDDDDDDMSPPMMFKVTNQINQNSTHCGVLEFIAEDGTCYMPSWMMDILGVVDQDIVHFDRLELPTGTFVKLQPQSVDFLEITDPTAVLENVLRRFTCLTKGDIIAIPYNNQIYKFCVKEILPTDAVSIIECDLKVNGNSETGKQFEFNNFNFAQKALFLSLFQPKKLDFDTPVAYQPPSVSNNESDDDSSDDNCGAGENAHHFKGTGKRLNGKPIEPTTRSTHKKKRHGPDTSWKIGQLVFQRPSSKKKRN